MLADSQSAVLLRWHTHTDWQSRNTMTCQRGSNLNSDLNTAYLHHNANKEAAVGHATLGAAGGEERQDVRDWVLTRGIACNQSLHSVRCFAP